MDSLKSIILIGPVFPYKSGIAHYTGLLYQELNKHFDTYMMSYCLQYPKCLHRKEQKDYEEKTFYVEDTDYQIHTMNPMNWVQTAHKIKKQKPDLLLIEWWHPYFTPCYVALMNLLHKKISILFLCHNVFPHERFFMDTWLTKMTLKKGDLFLVQSGKDEQDLHSIVKNPIVERVVHPTYKTFRFQNMSKEEARKMLGEEQDTKLLLFFGFVRAYKGLQYLIEALPQVVQSYPNCKLLVVGDFGKKKDKYKKLIQEKEMEKYVIINDGYIPDSKVEPFFAASNVVVLPYKSATQSGIVQMAYGFNKPVIVTNVGGLPDVVREGQTGYIVPPKNPMALAQSIIRYFAEDMEQQMSEQVKKETFRFSWERMSEAIERLWRRKCEREKKYPIN